jgi:hypothetical protein
MLKFQFAKVLFACLCFLVVSADEQSIWLARGFEPGSNGLWVLTKSSYLVGLPCLSILLLVGFSPYSAVVVLHFAIFR